MNLTQDLSILAMMANASVVVQFVLLLLIAVSFMSWYFIFLKVFTIHRAERRTEQFERDFWSGSDLAAMYQSAVNHRHSTGSLERIFEAGFREFAKLRGQRGTADPSVMVGGARRRRSRDRRGAGRHRDRPLRRDTRGGGLQPLLPRRRPARGALRELHGGVFQYPAAAAAAEARRRARSSGLKPCAPAA